MPQAPREENGSYLVAITPPQPPSISTQHFSNPNNPSQSAWNLEEFVSKVDDQEKKASCSSFFLSNAQQSIVVQRSKCIDLKCFTLLLAKVIEAGEIANQKVWQPLSYRYRCKLYKFFTATGTQAIPVLGKCWS